MKNQTGKYFKYAIGEIVLVVIGILIALQINTWNEARLRLNKETSILAGIHTEFLKNRKQLDSVVKQHKNVFDCTTKIIALFPITKKPDQKTLDSLSVHLFNSYGGLTYNPSQSSIKALTNTSSFDIISNKKLRHHIMSWNDLVEDYKEEEIAVRDYTWGQYNPYLEKHFDFKFNFNDPRNNFEALQTLEFEFKVRNIHYFMSQILYTSGELQLLQKALNDIIENTKPN